MSYFAPYVDESGLHFPTYNDILEDLIEDMQTIYGSGIYLGNDSQDYQMLSKFAEKIYDTYQALEIAYNAHSPVTAIGTGLDYIVAINGIKRKVGTSSTATLTLTGAPHTTITGGSAADSNGNIWLLPDEVVLDDNGVASVEAICQYAGTVTALANTITRIMTPTQGWESVTNPEDSTTGTAVEVDSQLRARRAESVASPSQSMLLGMKGALEALDDVKRVAVYENDTGTTDANGIPAHSICAVVESGDDEEIANTILIRKGVGCGTYGNHTEQIVDDYGQTYDIKFSRVQYVDIDIEVNISRRNGYSASTPDEIAAAIVLYLEDFSIGTDLTTSIIWMVAQQVNADFRTPTFSITSVRAARHGQTKSTNDVVIGYDEVARGSIANIVVNVT